MNTKGLTLIELLICLAIMGILASIAIVSYSSFIDKVRGWW
jgi:prepilin-type N-terminal cleavage/methylation domain-containing protein